jgi:hypothetical protein
MMSDRYFWCSAHTIYNELTTYTEQRTVSAVAHSYMVSDRYFWCSAYLPSPACTALVGWCVSHNHIWTCVSYPAQENMVWAQTNIGFQQKVCWHDEWACFLCKYEITVNVSATMLLISAKVKQSRYRPEQAQRVDTGIALSFLDLSARRGWMVSTTPWLFYSWERLSTGGWVGPRAGLDVCKKSHPHRDSIPGPSSP